MAVCSTWNIRCDLYLRQGYQSFTKILNLSIFKGNFFESGSARLCKTWDDLYRDLAEVTKQVGEHTSIAMPYPFKIGGSFPFYLTAFQNYYVPSCLSLFICHCSCKYRHAGHVFICYRRFYKVINSDMLKNRRYLKEK